ncbi:MAG: FmdB family zinc ribbon protein [Thermoanaerobaculia bacterium]
MPIYEYECLSCGKRTEVLQRMNDAPLAACPSCGAEVKKLISAPSFQLKGSGWYATDYGSKKGGGGGESSSESKSEKSEKPESKGEGKSESKSESKPEKAAASESKGSGGSGGGSE